MRQCARLAMGNVPSAVCYCESACVATETHSSGGTIKSTQSENLNNMFIQNFIPNPHRTATSPLSHHLVFGLDQFPFLFESVSQRPHHIFAHPAKCVHAPRLPARMAPGREPGPHLRRLEKRVCETREKRERKGGKNCERRCHAHGWAGVPCLLSSRRRNLQPLPRSRRCARVSRVRVRVVSSSRTWTARSKKLSGLFNRRTSCRRPSLEVLIFAFPISQA